jgi:hypothetical protein
MTQQVIRTDSASGVTYLREAVVVAFFLRPPISALADALLGAFDRFIGMVPADALKWASIGASSEEWKPFESTTVKRCKAQLSGTAPAKRRLTSFEVKDGTRGGDAPAYACLVLGGPVRPDKPTERCLFQMSFPVEVLERESVSEFVKGIHTIASAIPYESGYASPSLQWAELGRDQAIAESRALASRYPGYDIQMNSTGRTWLGPRVRGARWLTFLGADLAQALGGAAALRDVLPDTIGIEPAGRGVMIRVGETPELGDANRKVRIPALDSLARVLEPVTAFQEVVLLGSLADWDKDRLEKWERRFLDR